MFDRALQRFSYTLQATSHIFEVLETAVSLLWSERSAAIAVGLAQPGIAIAISWMEAVGWSWDFIWRRGHLRRVHNRLFRCACWVEKLLSFLSCLDWRDRLSDAALLRNRRLAA